MNLSNIIRTVDDFPKKGIQFKDISSILENPEAFKYTVDNMIDYCKSIGATHIVSPDARGFIWGAPIALSLGVPFHMARKSGKLPGKVKSCSYTLEYGNETIDILDSIKFKKDDKICIVDDVSATGGTAAAIINLIEQAGGIDIRYACVIDLSFLEGSNKLKDNYEISTYSILEIHE